jgi:hypothetical protein
MEIGENNELTQSLWTRGPVSKYWLIIYFQLNLQSLFPFNYMYLILFLYFNIWPLDNSFSIEPAKLSHEFHVP